MTNRQKAALETRKKLIEAARQIVSERGLAGTQVEEITKLCGVSKGTFYTYFKRKEDVVYAICWGKFDEIRDAALASREPFPTRMTGYMVDFCAYIEKESLKLCQEWIRNTADPDFAGNQFGSDKLQMDIAAEKNVPVELLSHTLVDVMYGEMLCWATSNGAFRFSEKTRDFCDKFLNGLLKPYLNENNRRK